MPLELSPDAQEILRKFSDLVHGCAQTDEDTLEFWIGAIDRVALDVESDNVSLIVLMMAVFEHEVPYDDCIGSPLHNSVDEGGLRHGTYGLHAFVMEQVRVPDERRLSAMRIYNWACASMYDTTLDRHWDPIGRVDLFFALNTEKAINNVKTIGSMITHMRQVGNADWKAIPIVVKKTCRTSDSKDPATILHFANKTSQTIPDFSDDDRYTPLFRILEE